MGVAVDGPASGQVLSISPGRLVALIHPYELDGRVSSHPLDERGFSTMNCYLFLEDDHAVLYSTGYSVHEQALMTQLGTVIGDRTLTLVIPRVEFPSMCNARVLADNYTVDAVYQRLPPHAGEVMNFRPGASRDGGRLRQARSGPIPGQLGVGSGSRRPLVLFKPGLRILNEAWAYDPETRTLLTTDQFSWVSKATAAGPWVVTEDTGGTTADDVEHFLLRNRYWWLAGADTEPLRRDLAEIFDRYDIDAIGPDHGCVILGGAVARHYQMLDDVLAAAATRTPVGIQAGRWPSGR